MKRLGLFCAFSFLLFFTSLVQAEHSQSCYPITKAYAYHHPLGPAVLITYQYFDIEGAEIKHNSVRVPVEHIKVEIVPNRPNCIQHDIPVSHVVVFVHDDHTKSIWHATFRETQDEYQAYRAGRRSWESLRHKRNYAFAGTRE